MHAPCQLSSLIAEVCSIAASIVSLPNGCWGVQGGAAMPAGGDEEDRMEEDEDDEDAEMAYEEEDDDEEADVPSGEPMSVGSTEVHDMLLGSEASPARSLPAEAPRRCGPAWPQHLPFDPVDALLH